MSTVMDLGAMSSSCVSSLSSDSPIIDSEEDDRTFIEISELDKLLGLPPPRFDLGSGDIDSLKALESAENGSNFDTDNDFTVPQKQGLPRRLSMEISRQNESETEVCYNKELAKVSVIKTELNIGSDGREVETQCNSYLTEPVLVALPSNNQDEMLFKKSSPLRSRGKTWGRCKTGSLNRVVSKLLAKSDPTNDSILQNLLLEPQCLQSPNSICDNPIPKNPTTIIPSPVINKLMKLGTSVEVENTESTLPKVNGQVIVPEVASKAIKNPESDTIPTGYLQIMESLDKAVGLTSDLTKKKKKKAQKRISNNQVPSNLQLLAEIENSENLTKFSFQVDAKQVIELPEGQKLYTCDICSAVYHRGFSLKRHYLKTHINYKHISKRDLHNCGILFDPSIEKGGARKKQLIKDDSPPVVSNLSPPSDIPDLYRCHTCLKCFMVISDLQAHLMEHPPVSVQNLAEDQFKNYTCPNCKARYQKKKIFLRHKEMCGVDPPEIPATHFCLYCDKTFPSFILKKQHHLQMHHPKKRLHQCFLCKTKMFKERLGVFKHLILHHPDEYIGCLLCKLRFSTREEYKKHNKENHKPLGNAKKLLLQQKITAKNRAEHDVMVRSCSEGEQSKNIVAGVNNNPDLVLKCTECPKMFASHLNMTRHRRLAHRQFGKKKRKKVIQKKVIAVSEKVVENRKTPSPPPPTPTLPLPPPPPPPPPDPEVLFYSTIAHNIRENLTHHLDGKLDSQEVMEYDLNKATAARNKVLNFSASFTSENTTPVQHETTSDTPILQKESRATPISPRAQWEKFNFPKNYDGRCGLTSYIKDMSHLDISTQLTMRRNLQRLNSTPGQESLKESPANIPAGLLLVEKPGPDCAETFGDPEDNKDKGDVEMLVLSGEWVRPRTFLCAACGYKSTNLWDVEDHKYALHPNVWVPHIEIVGEQSSSWDWFYHRRLPPETAVKETTPVPPMTPPPCSKCARQCATMADLHRHMLDCGGDTTWMATMLAVTSPGSRRRKWRPFGSRRRKQQGRRGLKRNIPNTPAKHSCGRIRTKPGDMDTIQKMIANLPAKRATRRVIGEDPDIKTRSQATIHSVPISSLATHSNSARSGGAKPTKAGKAGSKLSSQNKSKGENSTQPEDKTRSKEIMKIKEEPSDFVPIKEEESSEIEFQHLEAENTVQHSDILTSLQMIPVVRKSPITVVQETENIVEEPIETSKILAAMREAMMLDSDEKVENKLPAKTNEKKKKTKTDERNKKIESPLEIKKSALKDDLIICNGCGMQFDNTSARQRHKKKCVYWKEDKTSEDNKTNKCMHCGSVFPYLMALLKHNCSKVEIAEEPAMPELCPEQPVEEVQCDSVEEIPILSPVEIQNEDVVSKRLSLLESTINAVGSEQFDVSCYHTKYFNSSNSWKDYSGTKEHLQHIAEASLESKCLIDPHKKTVSQSEEQNNVKLLVDSNNQQSQSYSHMQNSSKSPSCVKRMFVTNKAKSADQQGCKNKKVSDIFKEVKRRRGRKRQKIKGKAAPKTLATKTGLRKTGIHNSSVKKNIDIKKKRSSNFIMLMKEWEKLEREGAVALGKRKRIFSNSESRVERFRTRRRLISSTSKTEYVNREILDIDTSQGLSNSLESSPTRRTRRTNSNGTINNISLEILKEISETFSNNALENSKQDSCITSSPKKRKQIEDGDKNKCTSPLVSCEETILTKDVQELKRKPGRPRSKSITQETEQHIKETIDSIVKGSMECIASEVNCLGKDDSDLLVSKTGLVRPRVRTSSEHLPHSENIEEDVTKSINEMKSETKDISNITEETEQHIKETIDSIVKSSIGREENNLIKDDCELFNGKKSLGNQRFRLSFDQLSLKEKSEENMIPAAQVIANENQDAAANADINWSRINKIIYNVSIGNTDSNEAQCSEKHDLDNSSCAHIIVKKRKKRRGHKWTNQPSDIKKRTENKKSNSIEGDIKNSNNIIQINTDTLETCNNTDKLPSTDVCEKYKEIASNHVSKNKDDNKSPAEDTTMGKRKLSFSEEETRNVKSKSKEIKTKQLSIADYLNITHSSKRSSESLKSKDDVIENNQTVTLSVISPIIENDKELKFATQEESTVKRPSISEVSKAIGNIIKKSSKMSVHRKHSKQTKVVSANDKPNSPASTSSTEDVTLSVIRDKVIQKKKKRLKLKKLLKTKRLEIMDSKVIKMTKTKPPARDEGLFAKEKSMKGRKKVKVGVSRNHWEVSIVEKKNSPVEILCEEVKSAQMLNVPFNETSKKFYCSLCDQKFESSYHLYEHQLTPEHKLKTTAEGSASDENDPVKYCKSIGNIINDLEKRTLNVAKVMHQLKQRDSTESLSEATPAVVESTSSPVKEVKCSEEGWQPEWQMQQEWSSRSTTPLWEGGGQQQQSWEVDSFSTGYSSSLGSIMDTVNKLLSSDQEVGTAPSPVGSVGSYSWADLQLAMGASDEEMAMLEQLGEHSLQEEYVYDNSRPVGDWPPSEDLDPAPHTLTDLDHQEQHTSSPASDNLLEVKKHEPISDTEDVKVCRSAIGRPRRLLGDYESREMVCPSCNKHFLGLLALQTHVAWSHCAPVTNTSRLMTGLKRRALLSSEDVDRRLVCFVCKEIVSSPSQLETHIQTQHTKKADEQEISKPVLSESAEKLKSKMSLALGGLVDRALNKLLGTNKVPSEPTTSHSQTSQADLNSGALQLLGRLCAARKRVGNENMKLSSEVLQLLGRLRAVNHKDDTSNRPYNNALANEMRQILSRGRPIGVSKGALQASVNNSNAPSDLKPTNLLDHLAVCSSDVQERPYACPICDLRFLIPSTRNRHIARAHGKYGRHYDKEVEGVIIHKEDNPQEEIESAWKDSLDTGIEANDDGEMLPLCSDCGLSFQSIHEVMKHRIEDHPRRFSADQEESKPDTGSDKHPVVGSSSESKHSQESSKKDDVKLLPVSDSAIDSTSTGKKKRGRPAKVVDLKIGEKRKLQECDKKSAATNRKVGRGSGRRKRQVDETEMQPDNTNEDQVVSAFEATHEENYNTKLHSPEMDKSNEQRLGVYSSEENLAELAKKLDRRKVRMGNMAEEAVRVKAEAALRELNLPRKHKSPSSGAKWGINAMKFTKHMSSGISSSHVNSSPSKPRFASLADKKWKGPASTAVDMQISRPELIDVKPDIYDFKDEDLDINKKPFQQFKESHQPETEHLESNTLVQSINWSATGSPKKTPQTSKLGTDSS